MRARATFSVINVLMILFCSANQIYAQEKVVFSKILEKLNAFTTINRPEKVYLQTDKDFYTKRDTLWFKTYIVDGVSHTISNKSRVIYVELVDSSQKVIEQRKIYAGFAGGSGDIVLSENIATGSYSLRAYTKYMLNEEEPFFFQKEILIWPYAKNSKKSSKKNAREKRSLERLKDGTTRKSTTKFSVQFFPEGGNLVNGLNSVLGLKITDSKGKGISLAGKIKDQNNSLITMFSTSEFGLGRVQFKVAPGTDYFAEIEIDGLLEKYEISKPLAKGYVLQVNNMGEYIQIRVSTNVLNGLNGSMLLGHIRGETALKYIAENKTENSYELKLSTAELNDGVGTFTLFTPEGEPVCERLVFIENPNNRVNLSLKTKDSTYGFRKEVSVDLAVLDELGLPLSGNFSMSVVSEHGLKNEAESIKSWLLLSSDLCGTVENPKYFFEDDSKSRKNLLDILMLTHGWRRFVWREVGTNEGDAKSQFQPEKGIVVKGTTVNLNNRQEPLKSSVSFTITEPSAYQEETLTDSQGKFSFGPIIFRDSLKAFIRAFDDVDGKKEAAIHLASPFPTIPIKDSLGGHDPLIKMTPSQTNLEEAYKQKMNDFENDPQVIELDEAIGKGRLKTKKQLINEALNERTMYGQALNRVIPDSILDSEFYSVIDLIERHVAGVRVIGQYPNQRIELRPHFGGNAIIDNSSLNSEHPKDPLYLLDGIPVSSGFAQGMFGGEVLFIDVLKNAGEIAQYGMRGANGVIALYTHRGENYEFVQEREPDVDNIVIPGFYRAREFYSPNYSIVSRGHDKPDFRTTLHWEPDINLSDIAPNYFTFYTGDIPGVYIIRAEGMTHDGRPISGIHTIVIGED